MLNKFRLTSQQARYVTQNHFSTTHFSDFFCRDLFTKASLSQLRNYDFISMMTNIQIDSIQKKNPEQKIHDILRCNDDNSFEIQPEAERISIENGTEMSRCCNRPDAGFKSNKSSSALFLCCLLSAFSSTVAKQARQRHKVSDADRNCDLCCVN